MLIVKVKGLLVLIRPTEAFKSPIKKALNRLLPCNIKCKHLSVFLNTVIYKYRVLL